MNMDKERCQVCSKEFYYPYTVGREWGGVCCPACKQNRQLARLQELNQEKFQRAENVNQIARKLIDLAIDGLENPVLTEKKLKVIFKSVLFINNEPDLFTEIKENDFLRYCYYKAKLGLKPNIDSIKNLPHYALEYIPTWVRTSEDEVYPKKVLTHYKAYQAELKAEEKLREEECKKSENKRKIQENEKIKADLIKRKVVEDEWENAIGGREERLNESNKSKVIFYFIIAIVVIFILLFIYKYFAAFAFFIILSIIVFIFFALIKKMFE